MKIIEIVDEDYYSRSNDHVILPDNMDINIEYQRYKDWYSQEYCPSLNRGEKPKYLAFINWLIDKCGARYPTDDELGTFLE